MRKHEDSDLDPPVTIKSSKADLWEELQAARAEIDDIHRRMLSYRDQLIAMDLKMSTARLQLRVIKALMVEGE